MNQIQNPHDDDEIDLGKLFQVFWRGKFIIAFFTAIFAGFGVYYAIMLTTPIYSANSVVMLNSQSEQIVDLPSVLSQLTNDETVVQTEIEVMRSRILVGKVVDELDLMSDPEFNTTLQEPDLADRIKDALTSFLPVGNNLGADEEILSQSLLRDQVIDHVLESYSVLVVPNTTAFRITARTEEPEKSARLADVVAEQYVQSQIDVKRDATMQAIDWLSDQVSELRLSLQKSENAVKEFKTNTPMISPDVLSGLERQLRSLRDRIESTERDAEDASQFLAQVSSAETYAEKAAIADNSLLSSLAARAETDPDAARRFDAQFNSLVERANRAVSEADSQLNTLRTSENVLEERIQTESEAFVELEQLTREAEANRTLYEYFLARLKETSAQQGIQQSDSRILSYAVVPLEPSQPNKKLIVLMSTFLGLVLGSGIVLLLELRKRTFRSSQELEQFSGFRVTGQVPLIASRNRQGVLSYVLENPTSPVTEAIRNLRTSVLLANIDHPPKLIMTTSSIPGEGKTTVAASLAMNFVGMGKRVLLIEGDLRRRSLEQYFGKNTTGTGLISALTTDTTLQEAVSHLTDYGIDILFGEKTEANAADILSSGSMQRLLAEAREAYDIVIIDTPPVLIVPDARVVSQFVDAVLFVVKWDSTHHQQVEEALGLFSPDVIGGLVLNQIDPKGFKRYGYSYGYGYGYAANYGNDYYKDE
ncbi:polysaccharide biosynthesis tyrosine autokinase [Martelella lutilitoris]|uniref:non-specific protein-tyrosine kinase n=1 Tax=Martelella lutilitoris TaxID=2583532 RepID=A0A5C4JUA2_9HYPH|nr:polysaccharide biosynthesis tyrosine autokinase [Martelella lutilitoris]TNB48842.1 polysaccharide biosynthesis tyrosine autokinase [Martelella lutilitoris]